MAKQKKCPQCPPPGSPAWMSTFSDMVTLLLTFFVLLLSMANFDPVKISNLMEGLQGAFGVLETFPTIPIHPVINIPKKTGDEQKKKQSLKDAEKIKQIVQTKKMDEAVKVEVTEKGIAIMLRDPVGFASGSADLKEQGQSILQDIGDVIKDNPDLKVRIEGHTDDVPIHSQRYQSNWELSSARALSVVQLLAAQTGIKPENMSAVGYGEHRPLAPNTNPENRSKNRRIQIFVDYINDK
ncbi:MAG: flagellar motor protein MotB [Fibromonadaceae bacterium]|jgi:chemotaxis protein MotB|nr:flagellar motor protein MotB [Fibromonadaceae bacterium]